MSVEALIRLVGWGKSRADKSMGRKVKVLGKIRGNRWRWLQRQQQEGGKEASRRVREGKGKGKEDELGDWQECK